MIFRLAWQCGHPHPRPMWETLTGAEYGEVMAMLAIEPLPDVRADIRAARIAWASIHPRRFKRPPREQDFMLKFTTLSTTTNAAAYKTKSMQRYGLIRAAMERKEQRGETH